MIRSGVWLIAAISLVSNSLVVLSVFFSPASSVTPPKLLIGLLALVNGLMGVWSGWLAAVDAWTFGSFWRYETKSDSGSHAKMSRRIMGTITALWEFWGYRDFGDCSSVSDLFLLFQCLCFRRHVLQVRGEVGEQLPVSTQRLPVCVCVADRPLPADRRRSGAKLSRRSM